MTTVQNVPLFTWKSVTSFFSNSHDDYERIPLLAIGCVSLLANKFEKAAGFDWSHVVDLGKIGSRLSNLTDYWEVVDVLKGAKNALTPAWQIYSNQKTDAEGKPLELDKLVKKVVLFTCKTFSNAVNFLQMFDNSSAIKGLNIHKWKLIGTAAGALYFIDNLNTKLQDKKEPEGISKLREEAKETYRTQHEWKTLCSTSISASILSIKIIGFISSYYILNGGTGAVKAIAENKGNLLLASFASFTASVVGSHFFGEQMTEFKKLNQAT